MTGVVNFGDGRFCWFFDAAYDDSSTGTWTAADFAGLRVSGLPPAGIDEVVGVDGSLTLVYPVQDPAAPAMYEVDAAPAVLAFDGGRPLAVPQEGNVVT